MIEPESSFVRREEIHELVTRYGAQGDGATDDTAAIQSAIDAAWAKRRK